MRIKKTTSLLAAMLMSVTSVTPLYQSMISCAENAQDVIYGDVNGDNQVNMADLVTMEKILLNTEYHHTTSVPSSNYDLCKDGVIDVFDLSMLRKLLLNSQTQNPSQDNSDYASLKINEVCTTNKASYKDENGKAPDWIEIYNSGSSAVDISGVGLSDGNKNRYKFVFPENTTIGPASYILVMCDDVLNITQTEYHAPFKLSATGETVYLTAPAINDETAGADIDILVVPELETDSTYGRYKDGEDNYEYLSPTPKSSNNNSQVIYKIEKPVFSMEGGFYDSEFNLSLTDDKSNEIIYTLDGSDPRTSSTAQTYSGEIRIYDNTSNQNVLSAVKDITLYQYNPPSQNVEKGMIVRAVCKDSQGNFSEVATNGYYINKNAPYYKEMKVISIATDKENFFDDEYGIYVVGNKYNEWKKSPEYKNLPEYSTENPTNYNQSGKDYERPVNIQVYENGELKYTSDVGVRISGNATRSSAQKSMTFYARSEYGSSKMHYDFFDGKARDTEGNKITEFDKVTIRNGGNDNDNARLRDDINQWCASGLDVSTQTKADCVVFIDGEFWGYYSLQEKLDEEYVHSHYGVKTSNVTTVKVGEYDGDESVYREYTEFMNWVQTADMTNADNYNRVCDTIDIQSFIDYCTVETYINNWDWAANNNNWMIWRANETDSSNPYADGKWRYMLYDTEYGDGLYNDQKTQANYNSLAVLCQQYKAENAMSLFYFLMKNDSFKEQFKESYLRIIEENFNSQTVNQKIDEMYNNISKAVTDTFTRFSVNNWDYKSSVNAVKNYFSQRPDKAKQQLEDVCDGKVTHQQPGQNWPWGGGWNF